jgi:tetratricopeptide (TPR) repeat protein
MNQTITEDYIRICLKEARFCEFCADADRAQAILDPIMTYVAEQQASELNSELDCELFLVYGSVISYQGLTKKEKYFQETALDFLTEARKFAFESNKRDLIAESEKQIGLCYWRLGQHDNAFCYFDTVLENYSSSERETNSVCLATRIYLIGIYFDLQKIRAAKELIGKIKPFVEASDDKWLQVRFYCEAAGIYLKLSDLSAAIPFSKKRLNFQRLRKTTPPEPTP